MTYSEFLLRSRQIVHDYRDKDGNVIVDATKDGIRWTSANLALAIREALMEFTRDIISFDYRHYYNSAYLFRYVSGIIKANSGLLELNISDFKAIGDILRLETLLGEIRYTYKDPDIFFSDEYQNNTLDNPKYVFTRVTNQDSEIETYCLPITVIDVNVRSLCTVNLSDLFILTNIVDLPFHNVDDLMLDYVARHCNKIEHDYTQYELNNKVIMEKFKVLKIRDVSKLGV